jgi:ABC-type long-subunit fatty acid transport system fused permease/ATPase subunit
MPGIEFANEKVEEVFVLELVQKEDGSQETTEVTSDP